MTCEPVAGSRRSRRRSLRFGLGERVWGALPGLLLLRLCHRPLTCLDPPKSWAWFVQLIIGVDWPIDFGGCAADGEATDGDGDEKETGELATIICVRCSMPSLTQQQPAKLVKFKRH